jgi:Ribbon-helix-helix domain
MKRISLKLDEKQLRLLKEVSRATNLPQSTLIRKGIDLALQQAREDIMNAEIQREIDNLLHEDLRLLKRLTKH